MALINTKNKEVQNVRERYERRKQLPESLLYNILNPAVYMSVQEKERAIINWVNTFCITPLQEKRVLEIGCGSGTDLLEFIKLGFRSCNLVGNELLEERAKVARTMLPEATKVLVADATTLELEDNSFDIVYQSTVFTSILDDEFQQNLANKMWSLVKPGGGILWYDFVYDNPHNPDVKGVPIKRIYKLFPKGKIKVWRITLAPPISRVVTKIHPNLYKLCNIFPFMRTHVLCWINKD